MLKITNLHSGYNDLKIIKGVSLELRPGTISFLMGPNGAGKSTLLKSIFNIPNITKGEIIFEDEKIKNLPPHALLDLRIAFVPQGKVNFATLSVEENLIMGIPNVKDTKIINSRMKEIYKQFPVLEEKKSDYAFALSGGEQQMLAIGRALMSKPKLLLMDEPSLGLAPKLVKEMFAHIKNIKENFNTTILIVEHNIKSLFEIADYGYILVQGKIIAEDKCSNLKNSDIMQKVFAGEFE